MATIQKRGDSYRVMIRRKGMKPLTKTFSKKALADRWAREMEGRLELGKLGYDDPDLGALCPRYLDEVLPAHPAGRTKTKTIEFLSRRLASVRLSQVSAAWAIEYGVDRGVSPATLAHDFVFLQHVLSTAEALWSVKVDWDGWRSMRGALKKMRMVGKSRTAGRRISDEELAQIVSACRTGLPMADLVEFAVWSCMRISEQVSIRWDDLDTKNWTVVIRDRKHPTDKKGNHTVVPLLGSCPDIIARQPKTDDPRIFPFISDSVTTAFQRARNRLGVEVRWHDLRHEGVSRLFELGLDIPEVSLVSGHRDWAMLRRYTALKPEAVREKARRLAGLGVTAHGQ